MISNNALYPKVFETSKVTELVPAGIIKLTLKQVSYNEKRDNVQLRICDYYDENGSPVLADCKPVIQEPVKSTSEIMWMMMNENGELVHINAAFEKKVHLRKSSYFLVKQAENYNEGGSFFWDIKLIDPTGKYTDERRDRLEQYMKLTDFGNGTVSLKPDRIKDLVGNKFMLSVRDDTDFYHASLELEVVE